MIQSKVALTVACYRRVLVLNGSQPSGRLCRPITGQRKLDETDIVQVQPSQRPRRRLRGKSTCVVKSEPTEIKEVKQTTNPFIVAALAKKRWQRYYEIHVVVKQEDEVSHADTEVSHEEVRSEARR